MRMIIVLLLASVLAGCVPASAQSSWSAAALDDLESAAAAAPLEGLPSEDAALEELARFRHLSDTDPAAEAQVDVAADALFASLGRSFAQGGADPARADPDWAFPLAAAPDLAALNAARAAGASPSSLLRPLLPQAPAYAALREELARVRAWTEDPEEGPDRETRIGQLRASLERWRWLARDLPARRIDVHIAQFELRLFDAGAPQGLHKVIVGARRAQTPSFVAEIQSVTINPSWEPPPSIARELLSRFRRNPSAAAREGFEAVRGDGSILAPGDVNWSERPFPYRLRQRPGPANALGRIRFDIPNPYSIRLHDTPSRDLFARDGRALSHGCIRVQEPEALAVSVLATQDWSLEAVTAAIDSAQQQTIALGAPLPVFLIYMTAMPGADGEIAYAGDVYRRDGAVVAALDAPDAALARQAAAAPAHCATDPMP